MQPTRQKFAQNLASPLASGASIFNLTTTQVSVSYTPDLFGGNAPYVEEMYEAYLDNPGSVSENWRAYFDALQHVPAVDGSSARDVAHAPIYYVELPFTQHAFDISASPRTSATTRAAVAFAEGCYPMLPLLWPRETAGIAAALLEALRYPHPVAGDAPVEAGAHCVSMGSGRCRSV